MTHRKMTEMRDEGIVAFIGPDETCTAEALVASAWNLPMISYVSLVRHAALSGPQTLSVSYTVSELCDLTEMRRHSRVG